MSSAPLVKAVSSCLISVIGCQLNQHAPFFASTTGASRALSSKMISKRLLFYLKWMVEQGRRRMILEWFCKIFLAVFTSIFLVYFCPNPHGSLRPVGPICTRTRIGGNPVPALTGMIPHGEGGGSTKFHPRVPREHHYIYRYIYCYVVSMEQNGFKIVDILEDEASFLCDCSPIKNTPKRPTGSKSRLTEQAKQGKGSAHCIVRKWPNENTPSEWGKRNRAILLHQIIRPDIWERLGKHYTFLKRRIDVTRLHSMRADDNGNEEAYPSGKWVTS